MSTALSIGGYIAGLSSLGPLPWHPRPLFTSTALGPQSSSVDELADPGSLFGRIQSARTSAAFLFSAQPEQQLVGWFRSGSFGFGTLSFSQEASCKTPHLGGSSLVALLSIHCVNLFLVNFSLSAFETASPEQAFPPST